MIKNTLLRDRMKRKTSTRRELNPRPQEFHPIGMYSTTVDQPLPQIKNYLGPGDFPKMFNLLTSGYSDQLLTFTIDDVTGKIAPAGQHLSRENASFAVIDDDREAAYFVHEVDNFEHSGAISRRNFGLSGSGFGADPVQTVSSRGNGTCHVTIMIQV